MRDGSRLGVLQRVEEKKEEVVAPIIPATARVSRPLVLHGTTYKTESPTGKAYVNINNDEKGQPFEVFINNGKSGSDLMAMSDALGRMISFVLRIHSPVPQRERIREIVSELSGIGGARSVGFGENRVRSLPDAIAKVLAKHMEFRVNGKVEDKEIISEVMSAPLGTVTESTISSQSNGVSSEIANGHALPVNTEVVVKGQLAMLPQTEELYAASSTGLFDICPDCGSSTLAYEEGCKKCYGCGYSEC
jgi:ribonucleoside-diphosphate reductase alpha chain